MVLSCGGKYDDFCYHLDNRQNPRSSGGIAAEQRTKKFALKIGANNFIRCSAAVLPLDLGFCLLTQLQLMTQIDESYNVALM